MPVSSSEMPIRAFQDISLLGVFKFGTVLGKLGSMDSISIGHGSCRGGTCIQSLAAFHVGVGWKEDMLF